jgi:hypothetical protein
VRGPAGENLDRFLGGHGDPTPLEPGEERAGFGTVAGSYAIAAGYLSERPGPAAGDGPWSVEYAVEVTPLEA